MGRGIAAMGLALAACGAETPVSGSGPEFRYAETIRMTEDLVNVIVGVDQVDKANGEILARDYASCVAAGYALRQGFAFARHVRTTVSEEGGVWLGDAVYTLSPALPPGERLIDAETKIAACGESGIPTV
jgi:hypothetical protein